MVLAPESELVAQLTTADRREEVEAYVAATAKRTERERIADRRVSGVFSGSYAVNPFTGEEIPVWISDYVLAGYGTGAIMGGAGTRQPRLCFRPSLRLAHRAPHRGRGCERRELRRERRHGDQFAPRRSDHSRGLLPQRPFGERGHRRHQGLRHGTRLGTRENELCLRDAIFSRQRYWGEPFPVYYKEGMPHLVPEECLPLELPEVTKFLPTETGEPPLGNATRWRGTRRHNA